jgi:hypothetical protein
MPLLNTAANSIPTSASTMATMIKAVLSIPGTAYQSSQQPMTPMTEKPNTQGLRGPDASAMAPRTGDENAISIPPMPAA